MDRHEAIKRHGRQLRASLCQELPRDEHFGFVLVLSPQNVDPYAAPRRVQNQRHCELQAALGDEGRVNDSSLASALEEIDERALVSLPAEDHITRLEHDLSWDGYDIIESTRPHRRLDDNWSGRMREGARFSRGVQDRCLQVRGCLRETFSFAVSNEDQCEALGEAI